MPGTPRYRRMGSRQTEETRVTLEKQNMGSFGYSREKNSLHWKMFSKRKTMTTEPLR